MTSLCSLVLKHGRIRLLPRICARTSHNFSHTTDESEKYIPIYRLSVVQACSLVNKLKKVNLMACGVTIPFSIACWAIGFTEHDLPIYLVSFSLMSVLTTLILGKAVTRLIGIIYVSDDKEKVKIAYLDHWGKRQEAVYPLKDVGPLTNCTKPFNIFYKSLKVTTTKPYLISFKYGNIERPELFKEIFNYDYFDDEFL